MADTEWTEDGMSTMTRRRATRAAGALTLIAVGTIGAVGAGQDSARAAGSYQAGAAAVGLRLTMSSDQFPVAQTPIDLSAPVAQVSSSSVNQQAFSSYPYPGDLAVSAPGLIGGLAADQGHQLPFAMPGYPMVANARCGGDTQSVSVPDTEGAGLPGRLPYTMTSSCTPTGASAKGESGSSSVQGGVGLSVAHVAATAQAGQNPAGTTTAVAASDATGVSVGGGLLQLSGLIANATGTVTPGGVFTPASSFTIGTVSVAGTPAAFGPKGFTGAPGQSTPVDVTALNTILKNAGIELTYITQSQTKTSITSAGVQISLTQKDPQSGVPVITRYIFGQVSANADAQSFDQSAATSTAPTDTAAAAPDATGIDNAALPGAAIGPSTGALTSAPRTVDLMQPQADRVVARTGVSGTVLSCYLILVLAGVALLGSSGLVAVLRKALPWTR
jgi:hypothetical protein